MEITTEWEEMPAIGGVDETYRFPVVTFSNGMTWEPYHSVGEACDQIDANIVSASGERLSLDIWGFAAFAEDSIDDDELIDAIATWDSGEVYHGRYGLLIPDPVFSNFEEALTRFSP